MNLVSMYGRPRMGAPQYQFSLFSMGGEAEKNALSNDNIATIDPRNLSDREAGLQALYLLAKIYPGITWGELINFRQKLGRNWIASATSWVGDVAGQVGDKLGDWGGDALRLITDEEVADGVTQYATAYATGGASEVAKGPLDQFIASLGKKSKSSVDKAGIGLGDFGDISPTTLLVGGGLILGVILLLK